MALKTVSRFFLRPSQWWHNGSPPPDARQARLISLPRTCGATSFPRTQRQLHEGSDESQTWWDLCACAMRAVTKPPVGEAHRSQAPCLRWWARKLTKSRTAADRLVDEGTGCPLDGRQGRHRCALPSLLDSGFRHMKDQICGEYGLMLLLRIHCSLRGYQTHGD